MARPRNKDEYTNSKTRLLDAGLEMIRSGSYKSVGINDVLKRADTPKGSFYHYFDSKKGFGLAVAKHYHTDQLESARSILRQDGRTAIERLKAFFQSALDYFESHDFSQGCLMCNLSTELADEDEAFQALLKNHWQVLSQEISYCIADCDKAQIGLVHLSDQEVADWLLNSWSGALTRMKAERSASPLKLFLKSTFKESR
jgi:TetR/AcrR family transcriptional repressor of nem operon